MQQSVTWSSRDRLSCAGCAPANVILCVRSNLVGPKACAAGATSPDTTFVFRTIEGTVMTALMADTSPCGTTYRYVITYDDSQLLAGKKLTARDVLGVFCQGCMTDWVKEQVGNEVVIETNILGGQTLITQHGCQFPITASGGGGGVLAIVDNGDGTYDITQDGIPIPGGPINVNSFP